VSFTVCVTALLLRLRSTQSAPLAFAAGLLGLWIVFLRPIMGSVVAMMTLWVLFTGRKRPQLAFLFALPLAVGAGLWGIRGLVVHGSFKPLGEQWAPYYRPVDRSLHSFVQSFGGSIVHWNPKAQIVWFDFLTSSEHEVPKESSSNISLPTDIYCSRVTPESLLAIKADLRRSLRPDIDRQSRDREQAEIAARLDAMTAAIRTERPFTYWVRAPIRIFLSHLIHSGTTHLLSRPWNRLGVPLLMVKVGLSAMYVWVVVFGFAGAAKTFVAGGDPWPWRLVTAAFLVPLLVQTMLLRMDEYRYFAPSFPFALILAASATLSLVDRARGRRSPREKTV